MVIKKMPRNFWFYLAFAGIIIYTFYSITPTSDVITETTTKPITTTPKATTITQITTMLTTTVEETTTTVENATTTIQVRKPISVMAYSCNYATDVVTLTISNKGNTRIEEDEIDIYINDEYEVTFGKPIDPGRLEKNSFQANQGTNKFEIVSPSNSVTLYVTCY